MVGNKSEDRIYLNTNGTTEGTLKRKTVYSYDSAGRLEKTEMKDPLDNIVTGQITKYDAAGNVTEIIDDNNKSSSYAINSQVFVF